MEYKKTESSAKERLVSAIKDFVMEEDKYGEPRIATFVLVTALLTVFVIAAHVEYLTFTMN